MQIEDLGLLQKRRRRKIRRGRQLISGTGKLPFNTDAVDCATTHPANRGGMTKIIEAVRQLRGRRIPKSR